MGDFGSATETMRIIDLFALQVFAKNLDRCNFRLLQHYGPKGDIGISGDWRLLEESDYLFPIAYRRRQRSQVTKFRRLARGIDPFINLFGAKSTVHRNDGVWRRFH